MHVGTCSAEKEDAHAPFSGFGRSKISVYESEFELYDSRCLMFAGFLCKETLLSY